MHVWYVCMETSLFYLMLSSQPQGGDAEEEEAQTVTVPKWRAGEIQAISLYNPAEELAKEGEDGEEEAEAAPEDEENQPKEKEEGQEEEAAAETSGEGNAENAAGEDFTQNGGYAEQYEVFYFSVSGTGPVSVYLEWSVCGSLCCHCFGSCSVFYHWNGVLVVFWSGWYF